MVTWFAGLFYLPRLFAYHCEVESKDQTHYNRFCTMERKLFWIIMTPGACLTVGFGLWLIRLYGPSYLAQNPWLHIKMTLVALLIIFHVYLGLKLMQFRKGTNRNSAKFYRIINEFPSIILFVTVLLVVLKPGLGG